MRFTKMVFHTKVDVTKADVIAQLFNFCANVTQFSATFLQVCANLNLMRKRYIIVAQYV